MKNNNTAQFLGQESKQKLLDDLLELLKKHSDMCVDLLDLTLVPAPEGDPRDGFSGQVYATFGDDNKKYVKLIKVGKDEGLNLISRVCQGLKEYDIPQNNLENLKAAAVYLACKDYKKALKCRRKKMLMTLTPRTGNVEYEPNDVIRGLEKFFRSSWGEQLSGIDAETIIQALRYRHLAGIKEFEK